MEQKPMRGVEPLDPPSPEIARLYLEEAAVVEQRREERIDRRGIAWQAIISAVVIAALLTAYLLVSRVDGGRMHPLLFLILVVGQVSTGFAERSGLQWRMPGATKWFVVVVALFGAAMVVSFVMLIVASHARPVWVYLIPGTIALVGFGGMGVVQLWASRGAAPPEPRHRDPLPRSTRWVTAGLGLVLGLMVASSGFGDDLASAIVSMLLMLGFIAWMFAWRSDAGPAALGRYWRWPQIAAFLTTSALIAGTSLLAAYSDEVTPGMAIGCGALVTALYVAAALVPDRRSPVVAETVGSDD